VGSREKERERDGKGREGRDGTGREKRDGTGRVLEGNVLYFTGGAGKTGTGGDGSKRGSVRDGDGDGEGGKGEGGLVSVRR
jgi:hypothetical protein